MFRQLSLLFFFACTSSCVAEPVSETAQDFAFSKAVKSGSYNDIDYSEPLRPQLHFTSGGNWLNDPNGMVFDGEKYHLFFQHNPNGTKWGNMTWGHATSPNMMHWTQHKHALMPYSVDGHSGIIYSGTAVVDHNNSLGVQKGNIPTLCAFFTWAGTPKFYQAMAYSTDRGATWTYWNQGRAVVENQGFDREERDPKVFWHEASQQWVMVLWVQRHPGRVRFFTSKNMVDWTFASDLMRDWAFECMDIAFMPVDGDKANTKVLIYDASFDYEVGTFDGKEFQTESGPFKAGGGHFYAAQSFYNQPEGRTVQIGWMRGPDADEALGVPFNQQMGFPCELTLHTKPGGVRLHVLPIKEIASLVQSTIEKTNVKLSEGNDLLADIEKLDLVDFEIDFDPGTAKEIDFDLGRAHLVYDCKEKSLKVTAANGEYKPEVVTAISNLAPREGSVKLRFLVDRMSVESFAFDGEQFHASYYPPLEGDDNVSIAAKGGEAVVNFMTLRNLRSTWGSKSSDTVGNQPNQ